jgi:hypothetical protein
VTKLESNPKALGFQSTILCCAIISCFHKSNLSHVKEKPKNKYQSGTDMTAFMVVIWNTNPKLSASMRICSNMSFTDQAVIIPREWNVLMLMALG